MRATKRTEGAKAEKILVDIHELQEMLSVGMQSAAAIGTEAGAVVRIGRRKLYRVDKIKAYIDQLTEITTEVEKQAERGMEAAE